MKKVILVFLVLLITSVVTTFSNDSISKTPLIKDSTTILKSSTAPIIDKVKLKDDMLGKIESFTYLLELYIFVVIGMIIRWYFNTQKGIKKNEETPTKFNLLYWIHDNLPTKIISFFVNFLILFIMFRFTGEIYNFQLSVFLAVIIGLFFDWFVDKLRNLSPETVLEKLKK